MGKRNTEKMFGRTPQQKTMKGFNVKGIFSSLKEDFKQGVANVIVSGAERLRLKGEKISDEATKKKIGK